MSKKQTKEERIEGLTELSSRYRGYVLERCVEVENSVNGYIMKFFFDDLKKGMLLVFYLLDRLSFDAKISVFQSMLQKRFGKDYKRNCDKMMGKIRAVKDDRNIFAHYLLNLRQDAPALGVSYFKMRNDVALVNYDNDKMKIVFERIEECIVWIEGLQKGMKST